MPAPLVIGGAALAGGLLGGIFGGKDKRQTSTFAWDPATQRYIDSYRGGARGLFDRYAGGEINPQLTAASDYYNQMAQGLGFSMGTGLDGVSSYFDPFEGSVISGLQGDFDRQRTLSREAAADQATRQSAFGGSRAAVLEAMGQRDVNDIEGRTLAQTRSLGFNTAADRLMADRARLGGMAQAGAAGQVGIGQFMDQRTLQALQAMFAGAGLGGHTTTGVIPGDRMRDIVGGALSFGGAAAGWPGGGGGAPASSFGFGSSFDPRADYLGPRWQPGQFGSPYRNPNPYGLGFRN